MVGKHEKKSDLLCTEIRKYLISVYNEFAQHFFGSLIAIHNCNYNYTFRVQK